MPQTHATLAPLATLPEVRTVPVGEPFGWLVRGLRDMRAKPFASLFYGACIAAMGFLLFFYTRQEVKYIATLTSGFLLAGPFVAIGLYDISRRIERGEEVALGPTTVAWHENANQFAIMGAILGLVMLAWTGVALTIFDAFYGKESPSLTQFIADTVAMKHTAFLIVYTAAGSVFAAVVFVLSVVSIPMLLDRNCDALTAMRTSVLAVAQNPAAMLVWAGLITSLTLLGLWTFYVGIIVTMPVIGHASWHAYRGLVHSEPDQPA